MPRMSPCGGPSGDEVNQPPLGIANCKLGGRMVGYVGDDAEMITTHPR